MSRRAIEIGLRSAEDSFAKISGFLDAAISEMSPSYKPHGAIEGMLAYQAPEIHENRETVRSIQRSMVNIRQQLREMISSLEDMRKDMRDMYIREMEAYDGKNSD